MKLNAAIRYVEAQNEKVQSFTERHGLSIAIEHPRGTIRELKDDEGNIVWRKLMHNGYGYFVDSIGRDGDEVDVMLGPHTDVDEVYVVRMVDMNPDVSQRADEDKCMVGFRDANSAKHAFLQHYPESFYGGMSAIPVEEFRKKLARASGKKISAGRRSERVRL